jgi:hypothetical protein
MTDLSKLAELARATTQPSPWSLQLRRPDRHGHAYAIDCDGMWVANCGDDVEQAAYIAAAHPGAILDLIERVRRLEQLERAAREWHRYYGETGVGDATAFAEAEDKLYAVLTAQARPDGGG